MGEAYAVDKTEHGFGFLKNKHDESVCIGEKRIFTFARIPEGMQEHYTIQRHQAGVVAHRAATGWMVRFVGGAHVPLAEFANTTTVVFMGTLGQNAQNIMNL
jgi:hypothetical protein